MAQSKTPAAGGRLGASETFLVERSDYSRGPAGLQPIGGMLAALLVKIMWRSVRFHLRRAAALALPTPEREAAFDEAGAIFRTGQRHGLVGGS